MLFLKICSGQRTFSKRASETLHFYLHLWRRSPLQKVTRGFFLSYKLTVSSVFEHHQICSQEWHDHSNPRIIIDPLEKNVYSSTAIDCEENMSKYLYLNMSKWVFCCAKVESIDSLLKFWTQQKSWLLCDSSSSRRVFNSADLTHLKREFKRFNLWFSN